MSIIVTNFFSKIIGNSTEQIGAHLDDEVPNLLDDCKNSSKNKIDSKIIDFFENKLKNIDIQTLDNCYSIGYCLGSFLTNLESFMKAPTSSKAFSLASLALGCGLPLIKLIPKIKFIIGIDIINSNLNVGMV